jgi:hypothetical protein
VAGVLLLTTPLFLLFLPRREPAAQPDLDTPPARVDKPDLAISLRRE